MATFRNPVGNFTFETLVAFVGALLVLPLLVRVLLRVLRALLSLKIVRRLLAEALFVGLAALLTKEGVLDRLFGQKGKPGSGLLKPSVGRSAGRSAAR